MGRVTHVGGEEPVESVWEASQDQRGYPADRRHGERGDRPEHEPDQQRDREQEAEEDRQARPIQVVVELEQDGVAAHAADYRD